MAAYATGRCPSSSHWTCPGGAASSTPSGRSGTPATPPHRSTPACRPRPPPPCSAALRPTAVVGPDGERTRLADGRGRGPGDALVVATSGSTGTPRAVVLTHAAVAASARATSEAPRGRPGPPHLAGLPAAGPHRGLWPWSPGRSSPAPPGGAGRLRRRRRWRPSAGEVGPPTSRWWPPPCGGSTRRCSPLVLLGGAASPPRTADQRGHHLRHDRDRVGRGLRRRAAATG